MIKSAEKTVKLGRENALAILTAEGNDPNPPTVQDRLPKMQVVCYLYERHVPVLNETPTPAGLVNCPGALDVIYRSPEDTVKKGVRVVIWARESQATARDMYQVLAELNAGSQTLANVLRPVHLHSRRPIVATHRYSEYRSSHQPWTPPDELNNTMRLALQNGERLHLLIRGFDGWIDNVQISGQDVQQPNIVNSQFNQLWMRYRRALLGNISEPMTARAILRAFNDLQQQAAGAPPPMGATPQHTYLELNQAIIDHKQLPDRMYWLNTNRNAI
nr:hypothetical protein B0A51_10276 [Rachicladosporium sp. CCFEE 5018]